MSKPLHSSTPSHRPRTDAAKVYRAAAEALEASPDKLACWGCCDVINEAVYGDPLTNSASAHLFERYFKPEGAQRCYWGEEWGDGGASVPACRILALCFMAAIVEAGDA